MIIKLATAMPQAPDTEFSRVYENRRNSKIFDWVRLSITTDWEVAVSLAMARVTTMW